jgi:hypothetical protein
MSSPEEQQEAAKGWSYLDANAQPQGPFPVEYLKGAPAAWMMSGSLGRLAHPPLLARLAELGRAGYFDGDALFWREGEPEWRKLSDLPGLAAELCPPAGAAPAVVNAAAAAAAAEAAAKAAAAAAAANAKANAQSAPPGDELADFLAEVEALDEVSAYPHTWRQQGTAAAWRSQAPALLRGPGSAARA